MKRYTITKSKERNYLWFQIAKNATRTTVNYLNENTKIDFGFPLYLNKDAGYNKPYKSEYDEYFKFTIARNPWDRILSFYFNKVQRYDHDYNERQSTSLFSECKTFRDTILILMTEDLTDCDVHYQLQTESFPSNNIDYIGRFENYQEDFDFICDKIKIPRKDLPHRNKSKHKHKHYTEYYDEETKEIVAEKYAKDIEFFGYKFGE